MLNAVMLSAVYADCLVFIVTLSVVRLSVVAPSMCKTEFFIPVLISFIFLVIFYETIFGIIFAKIGVNAVKKGQRYNKICLK